jgi:uncharacterized protein (TIGR03086 family)
MDETTTPDPEHSAPADLLGPVLQRAETVLGKVTPDTLSRPTPCESWTIEQLAAHMLTDLENFRVRAQGGSPDRSRSEKLPPQPAAEFRNGAEELLTAWRTDPPQHGDAVEGQTLAEFCLHTWDLERALGVESEVPPDAARVAEAWMRGALKPEYRGQAFAPERPAPDNATVVERLAAWSGRNPGWGR